MSDKTLTIKLLNEDLEIDVADKQPTQKTIENATALLKLLETIMPHNATFPLPFARIDDDGDIVFEWLSQHRGLIITIDGGGLYYFESEKGHRLDEMENGELDINNLLDVWNWWYKNGFE